ncbi:MAG TPA: zinc ribbon domain-containing protein [Anaerolineales bacterium]|nr:zinc ribbon domain-containing protein [Anaerolineales bacterium]
MDSQIIALKCPSCGNTNNVNIKKLKYGVEFVCDRCGTTSVAVINNELYVPRPGERVCIKCGRVSSQEARFCQCGELLIKKCINPNCRREIPINYQVCEYCGWHQDVSVDGEPSISTKVEQAIRSLSDPDEKIRDSSLEFLRRAKTQAAPAAPALIEYIRTHPDNEGMAIGAIQAIGESAAAAVPFFTERLKNSKDPRVIIATCSILIDIAPASEFESLIFPCLINIIESRETPQWILLAACQAVDKANTRSSSTSAIGALSRLVVDPKSIKDVKKAAFDALSKMGPEALESVPKISFTPQSAHIIIDWSDELSMDDAIQHLIMKYKDTGEQTYVELLRELGNAAIPGLIQCLQLHPDESSAVYVCDQIKQLGNSATDALPGLIGTLDTIKKEERQEKHQSKRDLISAQGVVLDTIATFGKSARSVIPELQPLAAPFNGTLLDPALKEKVKEIIRRAANDG